MIDVREIRKFGAIAFIVFAFLFSLGLWRQKPVPTYLFGILCLFTLGFILLPARFRPVYAVWMKISHFIGTMVTLTILTAIYYLVITPAAWIKRIFGGLPLPLKPDKDARSYWVQRTEPAQPKQRFNKRY